MDPWGEFVGQVKSKLQVSLEHLSISSPVQLEKTLEEPPDPKLGDLASTICFELAKSRGEDPVKLSEKIAGAIEPEGLIERVQSARGYVNFFVNIPRLAEKIQETISKVGEKYGWAGKREKVIIEHTSINPTKPLHVGHGRNAVLGDTLARIMRKLGYRVEVHNYIDDLGLQMAETVLAWRRVPKPRTKFDHALGLMYVEVQKLLEKQPELQEEVRKILRNMEKGGLERKLARAIAESCVKANLQTAEKLGVTYDLLVWESDITDAGILDETLELLKKSGSVREENGALFLDLEKFGLGKKVIVRSDGTTVYLTRDIAYQLWKFGLSKRTLKFKPWLGIYTTRPDGRPSTRFGRAQKVINVVGSEQKDEQLAVFTALRVLGFERESQNSFHLSYEHVWLPVGKFSGREGTWIGHSLDEAIEEAVARAEKVVREREANASQRFIKKVSKIIGIGALRFSLLSTSPDKKIVFKWEEALNFEKNSGPAVQYSHARACSILRKVKRVGTPDWQKLKLEEERELVKLVAKYPSILLKASEELRPNLLATYAAKLSLVFNSFYEKAPVLKAEKGLREARCELVKWVRLVLADALNLLGIGAPSRI